MPDPPPDPPHTVPGLSPDPLVTAPPPGSLSATVTTPLGSMPSADRLAPPTLPGFVVHELLGAGGMGVVWKATQTRLNRTVALKVVLSGGGIRPTDRLRFLAEAEAVAAVRHPHVVQVFESGEHLGCPYLAMEYLSGDSLAERLKATGRIPPMSAATLVAKVARAAQAAHDRQIVHRDLKAANVLFDDAGEPRLTDFGLAKRGDSGDLTRTQAVVGTPAYMSPEQARGDSKFVGPTADVWALGVVLYECLTGKRPFRGDDSFAVLRAITDDDPPPPRGLVPGLPQDVELVCLKCLAKDPTERYPTAAAVAADLERFAAGESVSVRPPGAAERVQRWARKHPTTAVGGLFGGLAAGLLVTVLAVENLRREAVAARRESEAARVKLDRLGYARNIDLAHREYLSADLARARLLLAGSQPDLRGWEYRYVHRVCHADALTFDAHPGGATAVRATADGRLIVTAGDDKRARSWTAEGKPVAEYRHPAEVLAVDVSADGTRAVSAGRDGVAVVWETATGKPVARFPGHGETVRGVAFLPGGTHVVSGGDDGTGFVWDAATGAEVRRLAGHGSPVRAVAAGAKLVVTAGADNLARVWPATGEPVVLRGHTDTVAAVAVSADGTRVLTGSEDGTAKVWDATTGKELHTLRGHVGPVHGVSFADGRTALTAGKDNTVRVWDTLTGRERYPLRGHERAVRAVAGLPGRAVSASLDGTVKAWVLDGDPAGPVLLRAGGSIEAAQLSPDGRFVAVVGSGLTPGICDATTGLRVHLLAGHNGPTSTVSWHPDGSRVATAGVDDCTGYVWDAATGKKLFALTGHVKPTSGVRYSPDGSLLVLTARDGAVKLYDARDGTFLRDFVGHTGWVVNVAFRPDGKQLATAGHDDTARVWDVATGAELRTIFAHPGNVSDVGYSPDGTRLVTAGKDKLARVWDIATGAERLVLAGHAAQVSSAQYTPDGSRIVTGSYDHQVKVWDATTGAELLTLRGHSERVTDVSFGPDPDRFITSSQDGTIRVWDAGARK